MGLEEDWLLLPCTFVHCRMMASLHPCWIGTGGSKPTPQTQIFSHQCGGHLQPVPPTNRTLAIAMMFVRPFLTGHCDHTVPFSAGLSLWLDSLMFWACWHRSMSPTFTPSHLFTVPPWREGYGCENFVWYLNNGWRIEVKLLLSANRKSYKLLPRRLAQQRMTDDLEWPWIAVSRIALYLCGSWASCL